MSYMTIVILLNRAPDIDFNELESLFSTAVTTEKTGVGKGGPGRGSGIKKPEIVHLVGDYISILLLDQNYVFLSYIVRCLLFNDISG
jgi:hypothetical protein